ncbi:propionate--CoA ligase [Chitinivorax sp. B]|uniref:propionate--CoA ligase n=1 Tax=Chitinivorax sp. B TaxID=2502235 RepID=UPI0010F5C2C4|nr:propionate--CoA ligase [Chitinivorax sp. B]
MNYQQFHEWSINDPHAFWAAQAKLIEWQAPFTTVLDDSCLPFTRWFVDGRTNLCHNALDRHLATRADQPALVYVSTETGIEHQYSFAELYAEVNTCAAALQVLGVHKGDRVIIYMPMVAEAIFAMLACTRIGAIHSVVFGGFASHSLASRIDDAKPKILFTADAGMRAGKRIPYKPLVDEALRLAKHPPQQVIIVNRGLDTQMTRQVGRDYDYAELRRQHWGAQVSVTWLESNEPSYILYTSGTTGKPKGVQRDTGGYAVALAASMKYLYDGQAGETMFSTSDIGWVVGHSYIVYGPLIAGMTTVVYEGTPIRPDAAIWWKLVEQYRVKVMFSSPTAIRVLKKQDPACLTRHDVSSLRRLYLAGEPLDEPTARWIADVLDIEIVDNYWQTETGWPILSGHVSVESIPKKYGSPGLPVYGFNVKLLNEATGLPVQADEKGVLVIVSPLPPGCLSTIWGDDERFVNTYYGNFNESVYSSFDWARRDRDGYYFILGRADDVINVAGHRLGTREIEEAISSHPAVAEVAVVGVADEVKGQVVMAFAVLKHAEDLHLGSAELEGSVMSVVDAQLGAIARPARVHFVNLLPKTRSGKLLRRSIQALAEGRDPGDLTTLDDPGALEQIRIAVQTCRG